MSLTLRRFLTAQEVGCSRYERWVIELLGIAMRADARGLRAGARRRRLAHTIEKAAQRLFAGSLFYGHVCCGCGRLQASSFVSQHPSMRAPPSLARGGARTFAAMRYICRT